MTLTGVSTGSVKRQLHINCPTMRFGKPLDSRILQKLAHPKRRARRPFASSLPLACSWYFFFVLWVPEKSPVVGDGETPTAAFMHQAKHNVHDDAAGTHCRLVVLPVLIIVQRHFYKGKFSFMVDQSYANTFSDGYSFNNREYSIMKDYTVRWRFYLGNQCQRAPPRQPSSHSIGVHNGRSNWIPGRWKN